MSSYFVSFQDTLVSPYPLVVSLLAIGIAIVYLLLQDKGLPPGPTGLPYIGYWFFSNDKPLYKELAELGKKYGDVFSFRYFGHVYINLGSIKAIREVHVTKSDYFAARMADFSILTQTFGDGIVLMIFSMILFYIFLCCYASYMN